jgi:hypothetical protein
MILPQLSLQTNRESNLYGLTQKINLNQIAFTRENHYFSTKRNLNYEENYFIFRSTIWTSCDKLW